MLHHTEVSEMSDTELPHREPMRPRANRRFRPNHRRNS
jgi:hypothetical protein